MLKYHTYPICKICSAEEILPSHFWLEHRLKEESYCLKHEPRFSKLTGKPIRFKNREFYFNSDFNDKNELKKWLKLNPDIAVEYSLSLIQKRYDEGKAKYIPCQVELRSLCSPNVIWYQQFCNYNIECQGLGLKNRFLYNINEEDLEKRSDFRGTISIDTREQKRLNFENLGVKEVIEKLDYGDYHAKRSFNNNIFFERKGLTDFVSTISGGHERFCKEIERVQAENDYLVILVECAITDALAFNMLPYVSKKIKASPEFIFHRVRDLIQTYPNIQFVFVDGREKAAQFIRDVYSLKTNPATLDLQYLIDKKLL